MRPRQPDAVGSPALCIDAQLFGSEGHHPAEDRGENRDLTGQQRAPSLSGRPAGPVNGTPILAGLLLQQDRCSHWACRRRPHKDGRNGRNGMHGCGEDPLRKGHRAQTSQHGAQQETHWGLDFVRCHQARCTRKGSHLQWQLCSAGARAARRSARAVSCEHHVTAKCICERFSIYYRAS